MRCLTALSLLALLSACVSPRAEEKISFDEAFMPRPEELEPGTRPAAAPLRPRSRPRATQAPGKELPTARTSPELQAALASFVNRAREYRQQVKRGSPMPAPQAENWVGVAEALDGFLLRPAEETAALDIVRARVTVEAELEEDARTYGDIPEPLADSVMKRVQALSARMMEVRRLMVTATPEAPRFTWPISPVSVTSYFGTRAHPILGEMREHLGIDLAARRGQAVFAAAPGVVLSAGWNGNHGYQVEIQHAARISTRYSHLSRVLVEPGQILERGDLLGLAGDTGLATGVHLHFELWQDGRPRDPLEDLEQEREEGSSVELNSVSHQQAAPPAQRQGRRPAGRRP